MPARSHRLGTLDARFASTLAEPAFPGKSGRNRLEVEGFALPFGTLLRGAALRSAPGPKVRGTYQDAAKAKTKGHRSPMGDRWPGNAVHPWKAKVRWRITCRR